MSTLYTVGMKIEVLAQQVQQVLRLDEFMGCDASMNGLQVGRAEKDVQRIVCAVDASLATFEKAVEMGADAIFVHHGLFWGKSFTLTNMHYKRIATLVENDIALLAVHLPLDAHPTLGNNASMAKILGLQQIQPFGMYHGINIGYRGVLPTPLSADTIAKKLNLEEKMGLHILRFGNESISSVGIISGGAANEVQEAIALGLDAYITGEPSHTMYSYCQESKITMICGGHYATEVFGVQQMAQYFRDELALEASFIELPTAL